MKKTTPISVRYIALNDMGLETPMLFKFHVEELSLPLNINSDLQKLTLKNLASHIDPSLLDYELDLLVNSHHFFPQDKTFTNLLKIKEKSVFFGIHDTTPSMRISI